MYLTAFPNQVTLIRILEYYGFQHTQTSTNGECVYEKTISRVALTAKNQVDLLPLARLNYPRFVAGAPAKVFCVPIQGDYHQKLFPEIALAAPLPLFPQTDLLVSTRGERTPGNTIRKVYLCRARTSSMDAGDVLLFYQSKSEGMAASQTITSIGIVEGVSETAELEALVRLTAKRSVFSESELRTMMVGSKRPVRVIDFLLVGHIDPPIPLATLVAEGVFKGRPPQSICRLEPAQFQPIRDRLRLGFAV